MEMLNSFVWGPHLHKALPFPQLSREKNSSDLSYVKDLQEMKCYLDLLSPCLLPVSLRWLKNRRLNFSFPGHITHQKWHHQAVIYTWSLLHLVNRGGGSKWKLFPSVWSAPGSKDSWQEIILLHPLAALLTQMTHRKSEEVPKVELPRGNQVGDKRCGHVMTCNSSSSEIVSWCANKSISDYLPRASGR